MTKEEAIKRLIDESCKSRLYCELYPVTCMKEECEIYMAIEALRERPRGKWRKITPEEDEYKSFMGWLECTNCRSEVAIFSNYCPNCGARMKGVDDEHDK